MADDCHRPGPAAASKRETEEQAPVAVNQQAGDMVTPAAGVDVYPDDDEDYDEDPVIWNLNRMARQKVMTPEWIEERKRNRHEYVAQCIRAYEQQDDLEVADEATMAAFDESCRNIFANVDLSGLNIAGGESCGMDAVGVYLGTSYPPQGEDDAAAAESSS